MSGMSVCANRNKWKGPNALCYQMRPHEDNSFGGRWNIFRFKRVRRNRRVSAAVGTLVRTLCVDFFCALWKHSVFYDNKYPWTLKQRLFLLKGVFDPCPWRARSSTIIFGWDRRYYIHHLSSKACFPSYNFSHLFALSPTFLWTNDPV